LNRTIVFWLLLAALATQASAESLLTPHSARYDVKISVLSGELETSLRKTPTGFEATHVVYATGLSSLLAHGDIREASRFDITPDGIRPREYTSRDTLTKDQIDATIRFDWEAGEARGVVNGEQLVTTIEGVAYDRVSIQYKLMQDLLNDAPGDLYKMFEVDKIRPVNITFVGRKVVDVPAGRYDVIGVRHQAEGSKRATTLWCAEDLDYLPVVIEQTRKEKLRVRAVLLDYRPETDD
jgi:hypothetical protein